MSIHVSVKVKFGDPQTSHVVVPSFQMMDPGLKNRPFTLRMLGNGNEQ